MQAPIFIEQNPAATVAELVNEYQNQTGKVLQAGQPEQLLINTFAYLLELQKAQIQSAGENCLVDFASGAALERLGALLGVTRLSASNATTTLEFTLVAGHGGVTIPIGTRVQTIDGQQVFETIEAVSVIAGINTATVAAQAQNTGEAANGFAIGTISVILDPLAFLQAAANTTISAGGADIETDDQLRDRIKLAPASFSTAGSSGSYEFWAKTASQTIIDVSVFSPAAGVVAVYPLVEGGTTTPTEIIQAVESALNDERVRPITDTVQVNSPTIEVYDIEVNATLLTGTAEQIAIQAIEDSLQAYADDRQSNLGKDVTINQIIGESAGVDLSEGGVYNIEVVSPTADLILDQTKVAVLGNLTVNFVGFNQG